MIELESSGFLFFDIFLYCVVDESIKYNDENLLVVSVDDIGFAEFLSRM
jgi:hypothetical protein